MTVRIEDLRQEGKKSDMFLFSSGQTVRVHRKIREGDKERVQVFEGLIIEVKNQRSTSATITVRKIVGGIGVEQVYSIHSPLIEKIELVKEAKVRRSKLYFMRDRRGKSARLKERFFTDADLQKMETSGSSDVQAVTSNTDTDSKESTEEVSADPKPEDNVSEAQVPEEKK